MFGRQVWLLLSACIFRGVIPWGLKIKGLSVTHCYPRIVSEVALEEIAAHSTHFLEESCLDLQSQGNSQLIKQGVDLVHLKHTILVSVMLMDQVYQVKLFSTKLKSDLFDDDSINRLKYMPY